MPNDEQLSRSRSSKPMMEKRRRARINDSLLQLKNLVLDALNKNNPRHSKLEKADILEMTVRYLRSIHRQQLSGMAPPNEQANMAQYQSGYAECMHEVSRYLNASSNTNNASDGAIILHNLTTKEVTERQMQASLLNHLVTHCTDYHTEAEKVAIPEQKTVAFTPRLVGSNTIPTFQFYASNQTPSMTSVNPREASGSRMKEETSGEGRRGAPNPVLSSSVYSDGASVATVDPPACPTVNLAGPTTSEGITVVLPRNLVYSGQIPTHVIPIYAASSPIVSQAPLKPATVLSNVPSFSASTPLMLTPVAPGNVQASHSLGSAVAPVNGRFAFIPTPPSSANLFPSSSPMVDSSDKPMQSVTSRQPAVTEETYLAELKSRDTNLHLPPSSYPVSSSVSSSPPAASPPAVPVTTSQSPLTRTTTIKQSSLSLSHSHPKLPTENTSRPDVTQPSPNQNIFRSAAPSKTNMSPKVPLLGPALTPVLHSNGIAPLAYQQSVTSAASSTPSHTPDSVNYSSPPKRQCVTISQVTEQSGVRHITPLAPRPPTKFNQYVNAIGVSRLDTPTSLTRCRSPHRFHSTRRDRPGARRAPQLSDDDPNRHDRNERYEVSQSGVSPKVAWRPW